MRLFLIRHGRQDSTLCNVDVSLSEEGRKQAELLGRRLVQYSIDAIYTSDLHRALETGQILKDILEENTFRQYCLNVRKDIREIDYGELEGIENQEVKLRYAEFFQERDRWEEDLPYPGGECGKEVYVRACRVVEELLQTEYKQVALVMHGGTIRSLVAGVIGLDQAKKLVFGKTLENTSITEIKYDPLHQRFTLERFNDFAHLEGRPDLLRDNWR